MRLPSRNVRYGTTELIDSCYVARELCHYSHRSRASVPPCHRRSLRPFAPSPLRPFVRTPPAGSSASYRGNFLDTLKAGRERHPTIKGYREAVGSRIYNARRATGQPRGEDSFRGEEETCKIEGARGTGETRRRRRCGARTTIEEEVSEAKGEKGSKLPDAKFLATNQRGDN